MSQEPNKVCRSQQFTFITNLDEWMICCDKDLQIVDEYTCARCKQRQAITREEDKVHKEYIRQIKVQL